MSNFIHGDNLECKIRQEENPRNKKLLEEIREKYVYWKEANLGIRGTSKEEIRTKVRLLNEYKSFIDQPKYKKEGGNQNGFTSQSQLHSSVIEEFMYYLFKDTGKLADKQICWGRTRAYTNLYFAAPSIDAFEENPNIVINVKNQDFAISKEVILKARVSNNENWRDSSIYVPIVIIVCKKHLDGKKYEHLASMAERIKMSNSSCLFLVVTETYGVSRKVEPRLSRIDQIYVLRRAKRNNLIYYDLVYDLFKMVLQRLKPLRERVEEIYSNIKRTGVVCRVN